MKNLIDYINEKLVINKKLKVYGDDIKDDETFGKYIISHFKDLTGIENQINRTEPFSLYYISYFIYSNYIDITGDPRDEEYRAWIEKVYNDNGKCDMVRSVIYLFSLPKTPIHVSILRNRLVLIFFNKSFKKDTLNKINTVFDDKWDCYKKINDDSDLGQLYVYEEKGLQYIEGVDIIANMIIKIINVLNLKPINYTLKKDEVIPGYTLNDIKKRYDHVFDDIRIKRSGNISLGSLREYKKYCYDEFIIYTNFKEKNGIKIARRHGAANPTIAHATTPDEAFDELDKKLRKNGYNV